MRRDDKNIAKEIKTRKVGRQIYNQRKAQTEVDHGWTETSECEVSGMKEQQFDPKLALNIEAWSMEKCSHGDRPRRGIRSAKGTRPKPSAMAGPRRQAESAVTVTDPVPPVTSCMPLCRPLFMILAMAAIVIALALSLDSSSYDFSNALHMRSIMHCFLTGCARLPQQF